MAAECGPGRSPEGQAGCEARNGIPMRGTVWHLATCHALHVSSQHRLSFGRVRPLLHKAVCVGGVCVQIRCAVVS